jgi:hypothetical protein
MNVASHEYVASQDTPSQEYETNYEDDQLDYEEEGFVESIPKGRSGNYTVQDLLIIMAWKRIGLDPAVGTEQPKDTYWARVKEFFDLHNEGGNERTAASIRHRWSTISADCQKWSACQANVRLMNPSGTNDVDRVSVCILFLYLVE